MNNKMILKCPEDLHFKYVSYKMDDEETDL